jgi:hypothetical protein
MNANASTSNACQYPQTMVDQGPRFDKKVYSRKPGIVRITNKKKKKTRYL